MNGRERMALAMRHQEPDRVPVMCQLALGHYFLNVLLPPHAIWFTSEGFAQALVTLQRRYRFDGILINLPGRPADSLQDVRAIEETAAGQRLTWRNGDVTLIPWDDNPQHFPADPSRPPRADLATLHPDRLDCLDDLPGYVWNIYHVPRLAGKTQPGPLRAVPDYFFRTIDLVRAEVGDAVAIHGEVFSPFTHLLELLGYEEALLALLTDRAKVHALLDRLTTASVTWAVAGQAWRGCSADFFGLCWRIVYFSGDVPGVRAALRAAGGGGGQGHRRAGLHAHLWEDRRPAGAAGGDGHAGH